MKPMLAKDWDQKRQRWPVLASPKFDGIRALNVEGVLVSRRLKPIPNKFIREMFSLPRYKGMDGELVLGNFQQTTSAVMSHSGEPHVTWRVFDNFTLRDSFEVRLLKVETFASVDAFVFDTPIMAVPHVLCKNEDELLEYEIQCLSQGHEGVMIRDPKGPYKFGRSTVREGWLLKVKRFQDAEGIVIGFEELMHNSNEATTNELGKTKRSSHKAGMVPMNTLGALTLRMENGVEVSVGSGFTAEQRKKWWKAKEVVLGKRVKFKFQQHGTKDKPRHPVFLGFRAEGD